MIFVVDVEGFLVKNHFVVKEFAYKSLDDLSFGQFFFKPPFSWESLSFKEKQTVSYCEKFLHCLRWSSGAINYQDRLQVFQNLFKDGDTIFVKGTEKVTYVKKILPFVHNIQNLETLECPKISSIKYEDRFVKCEHKKHRANLHCALLKVFRFSSFLKSNVFKD
jgi:hypothetical protein